MTKRVQIIVNPAAGRDVPILNTLNSTLRQADVVWNVSLTKKAGDGSRLAKEAIEDGVDLVAVYGGDGTVSEVASGMVGSGVSFSILPGGTANVMSLELGIPQALHEACALICEPEWEIQPVDVGQIGGHHFLLRVGIGFEAAMVAGANRTLKHRIGSLAYILSAFHALQEPLVSKYEVLLDGRRVEQEGITCIVANSGNLGMSGVSLAPTAQVSDGLLDVFILHRASVAALVEVISSIRGKTETETLQGIEKDLTNHDLPHQGLFHHWQATEVYVHSDTPQSVQVDGEMLGDTPISVQIIPSALRILVPKRSAKAA